jgi:aminoglycoside 3-N-acetyltransferase I
MTRAGPAAAATRVLGPRDLPALREVLAVFAAAFEDDPASYLSKPPSDAYLERLLRSEDFIAIAASSGTRVG